MGRAAARWARVANRAPRKRWLPAFARKVNVPIVFSGSQVPARVGVTGAFPHEVVTRVPREEVPWDGDVPAATALGHALPGLSLASASETIRLPLHPKIWRKF